MGALDNALLQAVRANGANKGRPYLVGHKTAAYTVQPQDCYGGVITNEGASGTVTLSLPPAKAGMRLTVYALAAQEIELDPDGTELINFAGGVAGDIVSNVTTPAIDDSITIICVEDGEWLVESFNGDWADE